MKKIIKHCLNAFASIFMVIAIILTDIRLPIFEMETVAASTSPSVENAVSWAVSIANDNSHGYSQTSRLGPDYDCSSLVISALKKAGFNTGGATYTGNMTNLTACGFEWIPWSSIGSVSNLKRGDILLNKEYHTAFYLGNNQLVEAHGRSQADKNYDPRPVSVAKTLPGDQDGQEIRVTNYYWYSHGWDGILRCNNPVNPNSCGCSTDYAGTYVVSTERSPLTMRSGHGTGYSAVTYIPKGSKVYVSKANGSWAHVEWNGYKGYCSMQYLTKAKAEAAPPKIHAWISDEKMGNEPSYCRTGTGYYLCFELIDPATGKRFNEVADANYKITETFYKPDGSVAFSYEYEKSDYNWICYAPQEAGTYTAKVSIDGDYTGEVNLTFGVKKPTAQLDVWISRTKMGEKTDVVPVGKTCYLCYRIMDKETKENWDGLYQSNYNVKETIAKSNGEICFSYSYTNDNNWIAITPEEVGEYKGMAEVTGDFSGQLDCQFVVKEFYYGDINADDDITVTDLAMVMQAVDDITILTTDQKKRADVNADGVVTKEDLALIQEFVLGTITEFPIENHVHSYTGSVTKEATCSSAGVRTYSCVCGESYTETIPKTRHMPVTDHAVAATCTEEGYTGDTYCSDCGQIISIGDVIPAEGHSWDTGVITKAPTSLEEGIRTHTCTRCGETTEEPIEKETTEEPGEKETENFGKEHTHNYTLIITKVATCTDNGIKTYKCSCGESYTESIEKTGHPHKQVINAREAGCTEEGYTGDTYCSDCGQKISGGDVIPKKGHTWDSGVITKAATSTEEGVKTYTCTICGEERTETIQQLEIPENGIIITDFQTGAQYKVIKSGVRGGTVEYKRPLNIYVTAVNIPDTITYSGITYKVTSIADNAFKLNNNLKKVTIGSNVSAIGQKAFANCGKLVSVKMSNNLVKIGDKAFYKCKSLTKITIPYKVKKIGYKAFYGCSNLKNIDIKTRKLTANNVGRQVFKGISSRAVFKVPVDRVSSYKKILKAVGVGSKVRIRR